MRPVNVLTMILAGGVGNRLYPLTAQRSKPAVPFGGNFRLIDFTIMNCVLSGLRRIHVLAQYHSLSLGKHKNERWNFLSGELGEFIEIVPPKLRTNACCYRGTADAVYSNLDLIQRYGPDLVLVLSGDHIYRADYQRFLSAHIEREADITVLTSEVDAEDAGVFGVIQQAENGRIADFIEKPEDPEPYSMDGKCCINLGVYCFRTRFLVEQLLADSKQNTAHDFGRNILPGALRQGAVFSCPLEVTSPDSRAYWRDVGTIDSYFQASMDLLENPPVFNLEDSRWPSGSRFYDWLPAKFSIPRWTEKEPLCSASLVSNSCVVEPANLVRSILSPGVCVGERSDVEECILFPNVKVGEGARLKRVIVEEGVRIPPGVRIGYGDESGSFMTSPGKVVVIPAGHRFDEPAPQLISEPSATRLVRKGAGKRAKAAGAR